MQKRAYEIAARIENDHWWFSGRRSILAALLDRYLPPSATPRRILEVGCGNGGNLAFLAGYGNVFAVEKDDGARERAALRRIGTIERGWLPDALPFAGDTFDLIAALDVLEHVEDDAAAVRVLRARLNERGLLIVTVPAFQWLWSDHDVLSEHVRRYTRERFAELLLHAGLNVCYCGYFNSLLFPAAVASIVLGWLVSGGHPGLRIPPRAINRALRSIFTIEARLVPRIELPFGLSIVACASPTRP